jgi:hypothetical protein
VGAGAAEPLPVGIADVSVDVGIAPVDVVADVSVADGVVDPPLVEFPPPHATPKAPTPIVTARSAIIPAFFMVFISSTQSLSPPLASLRNDNQPDHIAALTTVLLMPYSRLHRQSSIAFGGRAVPGLAGRGVWG